MSAVTKPAFYLGSVNSLWANIDCVLDTEVEERLKAGDCYAQHAAWDYCGLVWFDPSTDMWYEEVWQFLKMIDTLSGDSATNVIAQAIATYGVR